MNNQPSNLPQSAWVRTQPGEATLNGVNWGGLKTLYIKEVRRFFKVQMQTCLLYTSPSPRDLSTSRMPSSA